MRSQLSLPTKVDQIISNLVLRKGAFPLVGSYADPKQIYSSDIDLQEFTYDCCDLDKAALSLESDLRDVMNKIINNKGYIFSELKAGFDSDGSVLRWNINEVISSRKRLQDGSFKLMRDAVKEPTPIKFDVWSKVGGRWIEISNFLHPMYKESPQDPNPKPINGVDDSYLKQLQDDARRYLKLGNYFKVAKRLYLIARLIGDRRQIELLRIINTPLGLAYEVHSDIETVIGILNKSRNPPIEDLRTQIDGWKDKIEKSGLNKLTKSNIFRLIDKILNMRSLKYAEIEFLTIDQEILNSLEQALESTIRKFV